jgi:hypothetical protein
VSVICRVTVFIKIRNRELERHARETTNKAIHFPVLVGSPLRFQSDDFAMAFDAQFRSKSLEVSA